MKRGWASLLVIALFCGAAAYDVVLAAGWISPGRSSGEDAPGHALGILAALVAVALTILLGVLRSSGRAFSFIPLGAAAWMVANYYDFDPYYLPARRRYADQGLVAPLLVYLLVAACLAVTLASLRFRTAGATLIPLVVVLCSLVVLAQGAGH